MTHSEIDTLVRDWPEAARKGYQYYNAVTPDQPVPDADTLYWAMVGRGLAWLVERGITRLDPVGNTDKWHVCRPMDEYGDNWYRWNGATKLEAVSAAVLAAKEGKC